MQHSTLYKANPRQWSVKWWVSYAIGGTRLAESLKACHGVTGVRNESLKVRALAQDLGDQMLSLLSGFG